MRIFLFITLFVALLGFQAPDFAQAQGLSSLFSSGGPSDGSDGQNLAASIEEAAKNGSSVVVIDSTGKLISQTGGESQPPAPPTPPEPSSLMKFQDRMLNFQTALVSRLVTLPDAFNEVIYILRAASPDGTLTLFGVVLIKTLLLLAFGVLVEHEIYGKRLVRRYVVSRIKQNPQGYAEKMPFLVFRFVMGVGGILVSMLVAFILGGLVFGGAGYKSMQFTVTLINIGYFACRIVAGLWRMILSPYLTQYRIPNLSDRLALRLHSWFWVLATVDVVAILFGMWIRELGLNYDVYAFLSSVMSAFIVLMNISLVILNHKAITTALCGGTPTGNCSFAVRTLARVWAPFVIGYVLFAWVELTYDLVLDIPSSIPLIAGAYGILISIIVVYGVINYLIESSFARARAVKRLNKEMAEQEAQEDVLTAAIGEMDNQTSSEAELLSDELARNRVTQDLVRNSIASSSHNRLNTFEELARQVAGILAFVAGINAFFFIWDNDSARMVENLADKMLDIIVILFVGYIVYQIFRIWIDNKISDEVGELIQAEPGDEGSASSASRLATLLPLFRNFIMSVLVVTIGLVVMMQLGINVGPLFAGAGIVGVAIGFGSQALVRDVFAGAFFLFDDAFRKGEYLDVGGVKGTVEKISVRSFQLRHHLGALHTIPFGELQVLTNYSRDWVIMKLPLRVTYDTDVEKVRKLIKKLGQALLDDPEIGSNFIQPLKSQGVIEMQDNAMIIRVKFMTKPGDQWLVRKKVYEEIRELFANNGIKFAHREVTVRLAEGKTSELSEEQKKSVIAAAQGEIDDDLMDDDRPGGDDR